MIPAAVLKGDPALRVYQKVRRKAHIEVTFFVAVGVLEYDIKTVRDHAKVESMLL